MENTAFMHSLYSLVPYDGGFELIKFYASEALSNNGTAVFTRAYSLKGIEKS